MIWLRGSVSRFTVVRLSTSELCSVIPANAPFARKDSLCNKSLQLNSSIDLFAPLSTAIADLFYQTYIVVEQVLFAYRIKILFSTLTFRKPLAMHVIHCISVCLKQNRVGRTLSSLGDDVWGGDTLLDFLGLSSTSLGRSQFKLLKFETRQTLDCPLFQSRPLSIELVNKSKPYEYNYGRLTLPI